MKRPCEDSSSAESDAEESIDVGRESVFPGHMKASYIRCGSPTTTTQVMARKKRRGIIEKRRRDRINNSLSELRRLVPSAFEKQGSAKLEKAEILQMTVDHLKVLQATGGKGYFDAHALALDFLSLGFRECVTEVSRYLSVVEGLDPADPLRSRLLSHLTSCVSQRDAAVFAMTCHSPHHLQQQPLPAAPPLHPHQWAAAAAAVAASTALRPRPVAYGLSVLSAPPEAGGGGAPQRLAELSQSSVASSFSYSDSSSSSSSSLLLPSPLSFSASFPISPHGGLPVVPLSSSSQTPPTSSSSSSSSGSSKAYRPWGTAVGAF